MYARYKLVQQGTVKTTKPTALRIVFLTFGLCGNITVGLFKAKLGYISAPKYP